jgi:hypothetical protein
MSQNYVGGGDYNDGGHTYNTVGAVKAQTPNVEAAPFVALGTPGGYGQQHALPTQDYNTPQQVYANYNQQQRNGQQQYDSQSQYGQQQGYDQRQSVYSQGYQSTQYGGARPQSSHLSPTTATTALPASVGYAVSNVGSEETGERTYPNEKGTLLTWRNEQSAALDGAASGSSVQQQRPGDELPTQDLLRILNQRVAGGAEPQGDMPPSYQEQPR